MRLKDEIFWNENQLSLGKPRCMDTPTLIEWIQRQLETSEETHARHVELGLDDEVVDVFVAGQTVPIMRYRNGGLIYTPEEVKDRFLAKDYNGRYIDSRARYLGWSSSLDVIPSEVDYTLIKTELKP